MAKQRLVNVSIETLQVDFNTKNGELITVTLSPKRTMPLPKDAVVSAEELEKHSGKLTVEAQGE